jgi:hypothetical protein
MTRNETQPQAKPRQAQPSAPRMREATNRIGFMFRRSASVPSSGEETATSSVETEPA